MFAVVLFCGLPSLWWRSLALAMEHCSHHSGRGNQRRANMRPASGVSLRFFRGTCTRFSAATRIFWRVSSVCGLPMMLCQETELRTAGGRKLDVRLVEFDEDGPAAVFASD